MKVKNLVVAITENTGAYILWPEADIVYTAHGTILRVEAEHNRWDGVQCTYTARPTVQHFNMRHVIYVQYDKEPAPNA